MPVKVDLSMTKRLESNLWSFVVLSLRSKNKSVTVLTDTLGFEDCSVDILSPFSQIFYTCLC